jgi:hypothetical protein
MGHCGQGHRQMTFPAAGAAILTTRGHPQYQKTSLTGCFCLNSRC